MRACTAAGPGERTPARIALDRDGATLTVQLPPADAHAPGGGPQVTYRRMDTGGGGGDRLEGYFLGSYGSHGDELLYLQRGLWQGREAIIAHKITGACPRPLAVHAFPTALTRCARPRLFALSTTLPGQG